MYTMTDSERAVRATVKALHASIRAEVRRAHEDRDGTHRYALLAWGFVRGLPYRRIERTTRRQKMADASIVEHNQPAVYWLAKALAPFLPEVAADMATYQLKRGTDSEARLAAWLADPSGAIPAPVPRPKKPFVRPDAEVVLELQAAE